MRILYVTTIGGTMSFFEEHFKMLKKEGHVIELACNSNISKIREPILKLGLKSYNIPFSRNPLSKGNFVSYKELKKVIDKGNYDIIHCHTPNASVITRLVCRSYRKKGLKVFYTAHGFHFYKGAPLKNWMFFYIMEWLCSFWTDILITINKEDYSLAQKSMHAKKIEYIPGVGIDLKRINSLRVNKKLKREELGLEVDDFILLSVGELNENKNHITVIKAVNELVNKEKIKNLKYIICGEGFKRKELEKFIKENNIENNVKLLGFRTDVLEMYKISNCFVFPSYREGLSVSLMEAMASGLPCIVSKIRGNVDLIDEKGGFKVKANDWKTFLEKLELLKNDSIMREKMGDYNTRKIKKFSIENVKNKLLELYENEKY